jgi:thiol-disulfide isomerase/thioredoxin
MHRTVRLLLLLFLQLSLAIAISAQSQPDAAPQKDIRHRHRVGRAHLPAKPEAGEPAPRFETRTLEGQPFTNASLEGSVVLLQFWTTHCPRCVKDQDALDELDRKFGGQGLVVLAVDEGEPGAEVEKYLREHPRSCRVALDEKKELARRFRVASYPYYVVINRRGNIAASEAGPAGDKGMLLLVSSAGLSAPANAPQSATTNVPQTGAPQTNAPQTAQKPSAAAATARGKAGGETKAAGETKATNQAAAAPPKPSAPKIIDLPEDPHARAAKPIPATIFVLTSGEHIESDHYTLDSRRLRLAVNGHERTIPTSQLDVNATQSANRARGVEVKIPDKSNEVFVAF